MQTSIRMWVLYDAFICKSLAGNASLTSEKNIQIEQNHSILLVCQQAIWVLLFVTSVFASDKFLCRAFYLQYFQVDRIIVPVNRFFTNFTTDFAPIQNFISFTEFTVTLFCISICPWGKRRQWMLWTCRQSQGSLDSGLEQRCYRGIT